MSLILRKSVTFLFSVLISVQFTQGREYNANDWKILQTRAAAAENSDKNSSNLSIMPSFSYQFHTNEEPGVKNPMDTILSALNENPGIQPSSEQQIQQRVNYYASPIPHQPPDDYSAYNSFLINGQQENDQQDQQDMYASADEQMNSYLPPPAPGPGSQGESYDIPPPPGSQADSVYSGYHQMMEPPSPEENHGYSSPPQESYGPPPPPKESYGPPSPEYGYGHGGGDFNGIENIDGDGPPPPPPPLPPPPPPAVKGSIDYVLIPLILLGIAGPVFVVLYVILGSIEARLSPIARSFSNSYDYAKPSIDYLYNSVSRAIEMDECGEMAVCYLGSVCQKFGITGFKQYERTIENFAPVKYKRPLRVFFLSLKSSPQVCSTYKCFN